MGEDMGGASRPVRRCWPTTVFWFSSRAANCRSLLTTGPHRAPHRGQLGEHVDHRVQVASLVSGSPPPEPGCLCWPRAGQTLRAEPRTAKPRWVRTILRKGSGTLDTRGSQAGLPSDQAVFCRWAESAVLVKAGGERAGSPRGSPAPCGQPGPSCGF